MYYRLAFPLIIIGTTIFILSASIVLNTFVKIDTSNDCHLYRTLCWVSGDKNQCYYNYMHVPENETRCNSSQTTKRSKYQYQNCPFSTFGENITCYYDMVHDNHNDDSGCFTNVDINSCPLPYCPDPVIKGWWVLLILSIIMFVSLLLFFLGYTFARNAVTLIMVDKIMP